MEAELFRQDLAAKPASLTALAGRLESENPWAAVIPSGATRFVFVGMGSSAYAGSVAAARLRARGVVATSELASTDQLPRWGPGTVLIATSASGASVETLDALGRRPEGSVTVAVTNDLSSPITQDCDAVIDLAAGVETGGVACRSYQHTLALFLALEEHLVGEQGPGGTAATVRAAATASEELLRTEDDWRPAVADALLGPDGSHLAAPARRLASAHQGALMLREGPRRAAVGCESGDWSHVDLYLTKNTDYRLLVFAGSRWEAQMADWTGPRGVRVIGIGGEVPGAQVTVRYPGDDQDDVRLLSETLVPELVAAHDWAAGAPALHGA